MLDKSSSVLRKSHSLCLLLAHGRSMWSRHGGRNQRNCTEFNEDLFLFLEMIQVDSNKKNEIQVDLDWLLVYKGGGVSSRFEPIPTCSFSKNTFRIGRRRCAETPPSTGKKDSSMYITHSNSVHWLFHRVRILQEAGNEGTIWRLFREEIFDKWVQ